MASVSAQPSSLTIAGSDSGGGAGVQADLKTFASLGVHGTSVITCVTAQNPERVLGVQAIRSDQVQRQLEAVFQSFKPRSAKTGMLYSEPIIHRVAAFFEESGRPPLVIDPVMVATSGARLLKPAAFSAFVHRLLPLATIVTPNLHEARLLTGLDVHDESDLPGVARALHARFGCAALIKGGHLSGPEALDVFWDGQEEMRLRARRVLGVSTHGTGCTLSAAIAAYLALGFPLRRAVRMGKAYITRAIDHTLAVDGHRVLNHRHGGSGKGLNRRE